MKMKSVFLRTICVALPLGVAIAAINPAAAGDISPYLSAPSGHTAGDSIAMTGFHFPASVLVKVSVTEPLGQQYEGVQLVNSDGSLSYTLMTSLSGSYQVRVADQNGQLLANSTVILGGNR